MAKEAEGSSFELHLVGTVSGKTWAGQFRAKPVLSFSEQARVERLVRDMLGQGPYDGMDLEVVAASRMLAVLAVRLTKAPEWWDGGANHADPNLLMEVYAKVNSIVEEHQAEVTKRGEDAKKLLQTERPELSAPSRPPPTPTPSDGSHR